MKSDNLFWALIISVVFGVSLRWPIISKIITISLSMLVLIETIPQLYSHVKGAVKNE